MLWDNRCGTLAVARSALLWSGAIVRTIAIPNNQASLLMAPTSPERETDHRHDIVPPTMPPMFEPL
jgi:hypothetical protein